MNDLEFGVLAEAGQTLGLKLFANIADILASEILAESFHQIALGNEVDFNIRLLTFSGERDVDPFDVSLDIGDDGFDRRPAVRLGPIFDCDTDGDDVFADAIALARKPEFGAKGCLEEAVGNLRIGKVRPLRGLPFFDLPGLRRRGCDGRDDGR